MRRTLVTPRVDIQIPLMVILRIPPLPRRQNLRCDLAALPPLLLRLLRHFLCQLLLFLSVVENRASVLGAGISALAVLGGGVVHFVEELEEGGVGEGRGVEDDLEGFGVCIVIRVSYRQGT